MDMRKFGCNYCAKAFKEEFRLVHHQKYECYLTPGSKAHYSLKKRPFLCEKCYASYNEKNSLRRHLEEGCGKIYMCHKCGDTFLHRKNLSAHLKKRQCRKRCAQIKKIFDSF